MKTLFTFALCLFAVIGNAANPSTKSFRAAGGLVVTSNDITGIITYDGSGVVASGTNSSIGASTNGVAISGMASNINFTAGNNAVLKGTNIGSTAHLNIGTASNLTFNSSLGSLVLGTWDGRFGISNVTLGGLSMWLDEPDTGDQWMFQDGIFVGGIVVATNVQLTAIPGTGTNVGITAGGALFRTTVTGGSGTAGTNVPIGQTLYLDATFGNDSTAGRTNLLRPYLTASNAVFAITPGDTLIVRGGLYGVKPLADPVNTPLVNTSGGLAITNRNNIRISGEPGAVWYMTGFDTNGGFPSAPMLNIVGCTNVLIEGMTFVGILTPNLHTRDHAVRLKDTENVTFKNCTFSNWQDNCILGDGQSTMNRSFQVLDCLFSYIGGTNNYPDTFGTRNDGTAIAVMANNTVIQRNRFFKCLRQYETFSDGDVRGVLYADNISEGCYYAEILLLATNTSEISIINNTSIGFPTNGLINGTQFIQAQGGSNVTVRGNQVAGYGSFINYGAVNGRRCIDWDITLNSADVSYQGIGMQVPIGITAILDRIRVFGNDFRNCANQGISINANNSTVSFNTMENCNTAVGPGGYMRVGFPAFSEVFSNMTVVCNRFIGSSSEPAIFIDSSGSSNVVWGNEIDVRITGGVRGITDNGLRTQRQPLNSMGTGKMLYSDTNGRMAEVTVGSNLTFTSTGTLSATGGSGGGSVTTNETQFGPTTNGMLTLKSGVNLTNPVLNGFLRWVDLPNGAVGWSNTASTAASLFLTDPTDNYWSMPGQFFVGDRVWANTLTVSNMPGSGSIVAIAAGGGTFRTNITGVGGTNTVSAGQSVSVTTNLPDYAVAVGVKDLLMSTTNRVVFSNGVALGLSAAAPTNDALYFFNTNGTFPAMVFNTSLSGDFEGVGFRSPAGGGGTLDVISTYQTNLGLLRMYGIHLTNGAAAGYVLTSTDTTGLSSWQPASGGGTPAGPTNSIQYNAAGAFAGSAGMQIRPSNSVAGVLSDMLVFSTGGPDNGNAVYIDAFGLGARSLGNLTIGLSNSTPRWDFKLMGGFVPAVSNNNDIGTFLLPTRTNYMGALQISPNRGAGNVLTDVTGNGVGTWAPNAGATAPGGENAIIFAQGSAFAGTNLFIYNRTNGSVDILNFISERGIRLDGSGMYQIFDDEDLVFGVAAATNSWKIHGNRGDGANAVFLGSFEPSLSNTYSLGSVTLPASNIWANNIYSKVDINIGVGSGVNGKLALADTNGTNFQFEAATDMDGSNVFYVLPKNSTPGVMVATPVVAGLTNQMTNITLTAGQYVTYNGTAYVASNLPSASGGSSNYATLASGFLTAGGILVSNTATVSNITATAPGSSIFGVTNGSVAAAGFVGELVRGYVANQNVGTSGQFFDLTNIVLTPGDWDVRANIYYDRNGATITYSGAAIGAWAEAGNVSTAAIAGDNFGEYTAATSTLDTFALALSPFGFNTPTNVTIYLKSRAYYTAGGPPKVWGRISARRMR